MDKFYLQCHITNSCFNRCPHCYQQSQGGKDMSLSSAESVFKELKSIGQKMEVQTEVSITGGDPLMHPDFLKILRVAKKHCDKVYVMGNPEMLNDAMVQELLIIGINQFQLSLDGVCSVHDNARSVGSFNATCNAITRLHQAGIKVNVNMTLTDINRYSQYVTEYVAMSMGADYFSKEEVVPHGEDCNGRNSHPCSLGFSVMTILPDLTLMACRRTPSSVLGIWREGKGLEYYFVNSPKMIAYRARHNSVIPPKTHLVLRHKERSIANKSVHYHWIREVDYCDLCNCSF